MSARHFLNARSSYGLQKKRECASESETFHAFSLYTHSYSHSYTLFDFQKLTVYQKAKAFRKAIVLLIKNNNFGVITNDQLSRASMSIVLNIAEGSSRFSNKDRRHFMVIARGSAFECVAVLEILQEENQISEDTYQVLFTQLEALSKMLFGLIKKLES